MYENILIINNQIFEDINFPNDPKLALLNAFERADETFKQDNAPPIPAKGKKVVIPKFDESSCTAIVVVFVDDLCYVANLGDSRAVLSESNSTKIYQVTKEHRPTEESERLRVINSGGYIYQ